MRGSALRRLAVALAASAAGLTACGGSDRATGPALSSLDFPGAAGSAQPRFSAGAGGTLVLSWLEPEGEATVLRFALYEDGAFGAPREVVRSERMFVNWADFPSVTPITGELWFAHWLRRQPESFGAYDIATSVSHDGGRTWSDAEQMNDDATETEHGFVEVFADDGAVGAFWLDGRELANWSIDEPDALLGVSLRLARYDAAGGVTSREIVDELVCDCCQPDVALTASGPVVVYRDRTPEEIRDIVSRRLVDGRWSEPVQIGAEGWHIEGCPVNGPVVDASGALLAAAWFTAADNRPRLRFARSTDSGTSFEPAVDVDDAGVLGQPGIVLDDDGGATITWWRRGAAGGIDLAVRHYPADGAAGEIYIVAHETIGQAVDVPQLMATGDGLLVAWTTLEGDGAVRLASLDLER